MNTRNQKRQAEELAAKNVTTSTPNTILPASITNPTPGEIATITAPNQKKKNVKKQGRKGSVDVPANGVLESPQEPLLNIVPEVVPTGDAQGPSKRKKTPSQIAQQVAFQEAVESKKKAAKEKKKSKKAATAVMDVTPEETRAFLAHMKASLAGATASPSASPSLDSVTTASALPAALDKATGKSRIPADKCKALNEIISAHQAPPASVASIASTTSLFSSVTQSKSLSESKPKKKTKASTPSHLKVPTPVASSRDTLPVVEQLVDGDLAEYSINLDIDPATILKGIPKDLAPILRMPEPLPGPLYIPERQVPLEPIDLDVFPAADRAKIKAKRQLKVKDLKPIDQTVVSSALNRMGALIMAVCGFPNEETAWLLACNANYWASKKHRRHLKLTQGSEYLKLLYDRIPQMRAGLVCEKNRTDIALTYKLKVASNPMAIEANRQKVQELLDGVNFTLESIGSPDGMYEHGIFKEIIKHALFRSVEAIGVVHHDLFQSITLPCIALAAAAVEKVLMSYKSGVQVDNKFNAIEFTPIYFSHLATLATIYNTPEAQKKLVDHLQSVADELRLPYLGNIRPSGAMLVRSRVPQALIAARYRSGAPDAPNNPLPSNVDPHPRIPRNKSISNPGQDLVSEVKRRLGPVARSASASSTREADVVDSIYANTHAERDTPEDFGPLLAKITGSSDSEVQAARAGALEPNMAGNAIGVDPPGSDSSDGSDDDSTAQLAPMVVTSYDASGGGTLIQDQGKPSGKRVLPATLSDSEENNEESDGEGVAGMLGVAQIPGDVSMRTAGASDDDSSSDGKDDDDDSEGNSEEGEEGGEEGGAEGSDVDGDGEAGEGSDESEVNDN
ncbi:Melanoma-associated antigen E1 [Rhizoctonia solani]|uniref:Melanoma-associated antigen E1 n=1 Tax=Rhizoctonia solani TaxID=456999 RepID=A0A0K6GFH0_9AGAM|nr:Melanoma-associated antigen E1 [Rhizoctonia solani]